MKYRDEDIERIEIDASSRKIPLPNSFSWVTGVCDRDDCRKIQSSVDSDHSIARPIEYTAVRLHNKYMSPF